MVHGYDLPDIVLCTRGGAQKGFGHRRGAVKPSLERRRQLDSFIRDSADVITNLCWVIAVAVVYFTTLLTEERTVAIPGHFSTAVILP